MIKDEAAADLEGNFTYPHGTLVERKVGITIAEASKKYGLSRSSLYRRARENAIPGCRRVGHKFIIHDPTLEAWLQAGGQATL